MFPFKFLLQLVKLGTRIGSQQIVKMLLVFEPKLLHHALMINDEETVEILLENGADANCCNYKEYLPIHIAAQLDSLKNMQLLIEYGASVDSRSLSGWLEFVLCNFTECIFVDGIVFDFLFSEL